MSNPLCITWGMNINKNSSWCLRTATMGDRKEPDLQQPAFAQKLWRALCRRKGVIRCLRTATMGTGMAGVRIERWRVPGLTFGFTLLRPRTDAARCKGALRSICMQMCLAVPYQELRGTRPLHSNGSRAKKRRKWVVSSEKGCLSFGFRRLPSASVGFRRLPSASVGFRRLPSASVGLGGGLIFFHGVLADCHHLHGRHGLPFLLRFQKATADRLLRCYGVAPLRSKPRGTGVLQDWQGRYWQNGREI
ncbi:MAG: hypothetical protein JWR26_2603 [Pedosphaera sp.]|nr:hypothetical protein [Pedosphaera sp.]